MAIPGFPVILWEPHLNAAWDQYLNDGDRDRLFAAASHNSDQSGIPQILYWLAIGAGDWALVTALEGREVSLPEINDGEPWLIFDAIQYFGDEPKAIDWFIKRGARIDVRGSNDWTPLHLASRSAYPGVVSALVNNGADVNAQTRIDGGWTPLMEACASGSTAIVQFLLEHGADPEIWNSYEGGPARTIAIKNGHHGAAVALDNWSSPKARIGRWKKTKKQ